MRPEEIDYFETKKRYFFDLSNGEVLAGVSDRKRYLEAGAEVVHIVELGELLRDPTPHVDLDTAEYDKIDTSDWPTQQFKDFGRWVVSIVAPTRTAYERHLNTTVLSNAWLLGVGPKVKSIETEFGRYRDFYAEIQAKRTLRRGAFDDWSIEDFVDYIKKTGKDKRPTRGELDARSDRDPTKPRPAYMHNRFLEQGGFLKLLELAGYPVIKAWDRQDYIDWGVKFMDANDGQVPTADELNYFSRLRRGPSNRTIYNHFTQMTLYQLEIIAAYGRSQKEARMATKEKLAYIEEELDKRRIEAGVFGGGTDTFTSLVAGLGAQEVIVRYARYRVLQAVLPDMPLESQVDIAKNEDGRSIETAIRRHHDISLGEIESAALHEGVFDYLWPMDNHLATLKLEGDEDARYKSEKAAANKAYKERTDQAIKLKA